MLTVQQALSVVLEETKPLPPVCVDLAEALGLVTAEEVVSDVDSPPFDKALMDGFAVRSADLANGEARLQIVEVITAGMTPSKPVAAGHATRIMTGAPLPEGADAVVKVEETRIDADAKFVAIRTTPVEQGRHILKRGASLNRGERVLAAGCPLRPQEVGALAEVGRQRLLVRPRPTVAVLATGDELVPINEKPGPGQIRNSNETMLSAQTERAGGVPVRLGIARDDRAELRQRIQAGLVSDVLLLSGGVSEGTHDLVPSELASLGVRNVFHKVNIRPGKPLWFGVWNRTGNAAGNGQGGVTYVFGLPGNPVSSLICFELFVRSCLRRLRGIEPAEPRVVSARLAAEHVARGERPTYNPARVSWDGKGLIVEPVPWHGSSDLQATVGANAMAVFPGGDKRSAAGESVDVILWDEWPKDGRAGRDDDDDP
jgi:molybdopterin molybdotransferase